MAQGSRDPSFTRGGAKRAEGLARRVFLAPSEEDGLTAETLRETVKIVGFDPV
ncbi:MULTISPECIES: hypothetical protein [Polyangium]|uniref:Uncharacterized protein n=1 Tax=Polyangium sorediatum TaxID=889274 RepID=A0ABT6NWM7_9BACT|nr:MULTISPECIES: hypothetical protein [Polyangium]MDI1432762.1 hypothetical protein [Polyangium sorediatum]